MTTYLVWWFYVSCGISCADLHVVKYPDMETCRIRLDRIKEISKGKLDGVCVNPEELEDNESDYIRS